jgi:hypothetical protein
VACNTKWVFVQHQQPTSHRIRPFRCCVSLSSSLAQVTISYSKMVLTYGYVTPSTAAAAVVICVSVETQAQPLMSVSRNTTRQVSLNSGQVDKTKSFQSISYLTLLSIYRIFFHPLSKYPGPLLWKISSLPTEYHLFKGTMVYRTAELHDTYGPIIRIGLNSLTYILEDAWIDIYGRPPNRNSPLSKDDAQFVPLGDSAPGLLFEPDHNAHARIR